MVVTLATVVVEAMVLVVVKEGEGVTEEEEE